MAKMMSCLNEKSFIGQSKMAPKERLESSDEDDEENDEEDDPVPTHGKSQNACQT